MVASVRRLSLLVAAVTIASEHRPIAAEPTPQRQLDKQSTPVMLWFRMRSPFHHQRPGRDLREGQAEGQRRNMRIGRPALLVSLPFLVAGTTVEAHAQPAALRERVDIASMPWTAVGQVNNGSYGRCTGVLIARQAAITAAHCLFNKSTGRFVRPASVHFVLGYDRGTFAFQSTVRAVRMDKDYDPTRGTAAAANDWAWLELVDPAPAKFAPVPVATWDMKDGGVLASAGYGRDRAYALTAVASCRYLLTTRTGLLVTECPITFGYSGGPLLDPEGRLVGIQVASGRLNGEDIALAVPASAWIREMRKQ